jgi:hypothetical protein
MESRCESMSEAEHETVMKHYEAFRNKELPELAKQIKEAKTDEERFRLLAKGADKVYKVAMEYMRADRKRVETEVAELRQQINALKKKQAHSK